MSDERKYAVLSTESIKLIAGTVGFDGLPDDIAAALAEDVTYRLREAAQVSEYEWSTCLGRPTE